MRLEMRNAIEVSLLFFPLLLLASCGALQVGSQRYDPAAAHVRRYGAAKGLTQEEMKKLWRVESEGRVFDFQPYPEYPQPDESVALTLTVHKRRMGRMTPLSGGVVSVKTHRSADLRRIDVTKTSAEYEEVSPGTYRTWMTFAGGGDWEVDFSILTPDGKTFGVYFPMRVKGPLYSRASAWE